MFTDYFLPFLYRLFFTDKDAHWKIASIPGNMKWITLDMNIERKWPVRIQ